MTLQFSKHHFCYPNNAIRSQISFEPILSVYMATDLSQCTAGWAEQCTITAFSFLRAHIRFATAWWLFKKCHSALKLELYRHLDQLLSGTVTKLLSGTHLLCLPRIYSCLEPCFLGSMFFSFWLSSLYLLLPDFLSTCVGSDSLSLSVYYFGSEI